MARVLIIIGIVLVLLGLILKYTPELITWFGKLPGDIKIDSGNTKVFFPITSSIVISIVLTILINLFRRFF